MFDENFEKVGNLKVKCDDEGILIHDHLFESDVSQYLPILEPLRGNDNQILLRQPYVPKQPTSWWKAQCTFRGIHIRGRVPDPTVYQARLRAAPTSPMTPQMKQIEERLIKAYTEIQDRKCREANAKRDREWRRASVDKKADMNCGRLLDEHFVVGKPSVGPLILKSEAASWVLRSLILRSIQERELAFEQLDFPKGHPQRTEEHTCILIVGQSSSDFNKNKEWTKVKQGIKQAEDKRKDAIKKNQRPILDATGKGKDWNVAGTYEVTCPEITEQWDHKDLELKIFTTGSGAKSQTFAIFDFGVVTGVMRFEKQPEDRPKTSVTKQPTSRKRTRDGYGKGDNNLSNFFLTTVRLPSKRHTKWTFLWRGEEAGEGEIQNDNDQCEITFGEPRGLVIKGTFNSSFFTAEFTGVKVAAGREASTDPDYEWKKRGDNAYGYARVNRW